MLITGDNRMSRIMSCVEGAAAFQLGAAEALGIARGQIEVIVGGWEAVCDEAGLSGVDRELLRGRQFLNAYAFEGAPEGLRGTVG